MPTHLRVLLQVAHFTSVIKARVCLALCQLTPGPWTLVIQIGSGKTASTGTITFTVE